MAHYNHKLLTAIDKFFKLAQQAPDDDLIQEEPDDADSQLKSQLFDQWKASYKELRDTENRYQEKFKSNIRNDIRQSMPGKAQQQPAQPAQPVTPEQKIISGLISGKIYATINNNKGDFAKNVNDTIVNLVDKHFLEKGDVKKTVQERMVGFSIRVTIAPSATAHVELFITDAQLKAKYINDFNTAWRAVFDYLSPIIQNNIQYTMRKNPDVKLEKGLVIDSFFKS